MDMLHEYVFELDGGGYVAFVEIERWVRVGFSTLCLVMGSGERSYPGEYFLICICEVVDGDDAATARRSGGTEGAKRASRLLFAFLKDFQDSVRSNESAPAWSSNGQLEA